jgi:DNA-3-methyladenine glycosylase I
MNQPLAQDLPRCTWPGKDELYIRYHDTEWGVPVTGDNAMFERISLEGFQAGLSWITILKRRDAFREAFHGFDIEKVAAIGDDEVEALVQNAGIIRHRAKILSTIRNAKICLDLPQGISDLVWSFAPPTDKRTPLASEAATKTQSFESDALSKELKRLGFGFVGSTTMFALIQATGMLNDHAPDCYRRAELT